LGSAFFFFQAEDGIRDFHVTGVQTCALPISTTTISNFLLRCNQKFRVMVRPGEIPWQTRVRPTGTAAAGTRPAMLPAAGRDHPGVAVCGRSVLRRGCSRRCGPAAGLFPAGLFSAGPACGRTVPGGVDMGLEVSVNAGVELAVTRSVG